MGQAMRNSRKRAAVLDAIRGTTCHPSAEWIYQTLKPDHPDLSLGTVYRNLALFRENGTIRCIGVVQGQERFDAVTAPHSHFICDRCGAVTDLPGLCPAGDLDRQVSEQYGFAVERHELTFHGTCQNCLKQN